MTTIKKKKSSGEGTKPVRTFSTSSVAKRPRREAVILSPQDKAIKVLREDERVQALSDLFKLDKKYHIDIEGYRRDARLMHKTRTIRKLDGEQVVEGRGFAKRLVSSVAIEVACRGSLTEMLTAAQSVRHRLRKHLESIEDYLLVTYNYEISLAHKTVKDRDAFISTQLSLYFKHLDEVDNLVMELEFYITDIDKAGYAVRAMTDIFRAVFATEGRTDL